MHAAGRKQLSDRWWVCIKKKGETVTLTHGAVRPVSRVIHDLVAFKYHHGGRREYRV